jgi:hypothetical protein
VKLADRMGLRPVIREIVKAREENVGAEDVGDAFTGGVL